MIKFDVVLQGPIYSETETIARNFLNCDWVNNLIISTWHNQQDITLNKTKLIKAQDVENPGIGNRNRQIVSSLNGIKLTDTEFIIKARTDQIFNLENLNLMYSIFLDHINENKIYTLGLFKTYPFHPRDWMFWGKREKILSLFDIPLDPYIGVEDYNQITRAETYIAMWYYAKHNYKVYHMIDNYNQYLTDNAPFKNEAMAIDKDLTQELFNAFPKIDFKWPKNGLNSYHFDLAESIGQYWGE